MGIDRLIIYFSEKLRIILIWRKWKTKFVLNTVPKGENQ